MSAGKGARRMHGRATVAVLVLLAALLLPAAPAAARLKTYTLQYGPVRMAGFNVKLPKVKVPAPRVNGYIVQMNAELVNSQGRRVTIRDVMLHHLVFHRRRESSVRNACSSPHGEAFYGTGEEQQQLRLPAGYGIRIGKDDKWRVTAMLMSHSMEAFNVYIRYRVTVETDRRLTPVHAFWVRANGCSPSVSYPVYGGGAPGSTDLRRYDWTAPYDARIVAVGGHLHGGAKDMWLSQPRCEDRRLLDTRPFFGMPDHLYYRVRPVLHEPGPMDTHYFLSQDRHRDPQGREDPAHRRLRRREPAPARDVDHARLPRARHASAQGLRGAAGRHPLPAEDDQRAARAAGGQGAAERRQRPGPHVRDPRSAVARAPAVRAAPRSICATTSSPSPTSRCRSAPT